MIEVEVKVTHANGRVDRQKLVHDPDEASTTTARDFAERVGVVIDLMDAKRASADALHRGVASDADRALMAATGIDEEQLARSKRPHENEPTTMPYRGCAVCGFGPGAIQHNAAAARAADERRRRG